MSSGAGAKVAWHVASRTVHDELRDMFGTDEIHRLSFEEGEAARKAVLSAYKACQRMGTVYGQRFDEKGKLRLCAGAEIAKRLSGDLIIFLQDSEQKGVYRSGQQAVLRRLIDLLQYDGSCIFLSDQSLAAGVLLDYESDDVDSQYELEAWGKEAQGM